MAQKRHFAQPLEEFDEWLQSRRQNLSDNDAAITEIDLREEQEQLLLGANLGGQAPSSSQKLLHEEKEETPLARTLLQRKLENIKSKCGLERVSKDVERCLLLGLEEMMHRLIRNLIRMSKQRVDFEKTRRQILITSNLQHQIMVMNQEAQARDKQQSRKENEDGGDIDKDANSSKASKPSKEKIGVDPMLRRAAANKAVRAVLGGDDLTSKWKLMSKKSQQKEDTRIGATLHARPSEKMIVVSQTSGTRVSDCQELQGKGTEDISQQQQFLVARRRVVSIRDLIAMLERDPQMLKSRFIYCLYERSRIHATADK